MSEHVTQSAEIDRHVIRWEFDHDTVCATAVCLSGPEAHCRLEPTSYDECQCESWNVERDAEGWFHMGYDSGADADVRHALTIGKECNVCNWLNAEGGGYLSELADKTVGRFTIGETSILPVWRGDEGCDWKLSDPRTSPGASQ